MSARSFFRGLERLAGGSRRSPEEALRESEARFAQVFHAGPLAVAITRVRDGHVVDASESFLELFGYARDEVNGRTTLELGLYAEPEDRARAAAVVREQGIVRSLDIKGCTKSGEVRDLLLSASAIDLEGEPCFLSIAEDVTERNQALEALRESEGRFRSTLDAMLEGCQIIGFDWRYLYVNDAVASHGRTTKDGLLGHTMMEVYPDIDDTEMFGYLRRCMEERISHRMVNEFTYPDGAKAWFELGIEPVPEGILILSLDITDRVRAEEAFQRAREELEGKVEHQMRRRNPYGLTFREFTVLHLVADGKADKEIARELGISPLTVHKHVFSILARMNASSRTEAGVRALREGLLA